MSALGGELAAEGVVTTAGKAREARLLLGLAEPVLCDVA